MLRWIAREVTKVWQALVADVDVWVDKLLAKHPFQESRQLWRQCLTDNLDIIINIKLDILLLQHGPQVW